jgi:hypothetical protein
LRARDRAGDVLPVEQHLRLRLVGLLLPKGEGDGESGDEDGGADDVPLPPPENPEIVSEGARLRASCSSRGDIGGLAEKVSPSVVIF